MTRFFVRSMRAGSPPPVVWWLGLVLVLVNAHSFAAGLDARLDRNKIVEGDTVVLTLKADGSSQGSPNLRPLSKDFAVLNQSQSTSMQFINGRSSSSREWQVMLSPKHSGKLTVPALHMGSLSSAPIRLQVLPAAQAAKLGKAQPVLLQVEATPDKPYVQGQILYTVRLLTRVPLEQASLSDPVAGDAIVQRMGKDQYSSTYHDGQSYRVIERRYVIFPQHSGSLHIQGPTLNAQVAEPNSGRSRRATQGPFSQFDQLFGQSPFAGFAATRPIQLHARSVDVDVQAQPPGTPTPWLPAESLKLSEQWSPNPPVFQVGEPVTRSLIIDAKGLSAVQLPDLSQANVPGINQYPDRPTSHTGISDNTVVSQKVIKVALVPSRAGRFTLPAIKLAWWNTKTHRQEVASLPARTIQVKPGVGAATAAPTAPAAGSMSAPSGGAPAAAAPASSGASSGGPSAAAPAANHSSPKGAVMRWLGPIDQAGHWPWLAAGFALLWLLTGGLWLAARRSAPAAALSGGDSPKQVEPRPDSRAALQAAAAAFRANNARAARQALLDWGAASWPEQPPRQLQQLKQRLAPAAGVILDQLDRHLYAPDGKSWNGERDWELLEPLLKGPAAGSAGQAANPLPPLYPDQR